MLVNTNEPFSQCAQNIPEDSALIKETNQASQDVKKSDKNSSLDVPNNQYYVQKMKQLLQCTEEAKRERAADNFAWQLASHTYKDETPANEFLSILKTKKISLETDPLPASKKLLETISSLITRIDQIKNDPGKITPFKSLPFDVWDYILFKTDNYGQKGLADFRGISKQIDAIIQDVVIREINNNKLSLPELGFYSISQITQFFGKKLSELKHIDLTAPNVVRRNWLGEYFWKLDPLRKKRDKAHQNSLLSHKISDKFNKELTEWGSLISQVDQMVEQIPPSSDQFLLLQYTNIVRDRHAVAIAKLQKLFSLISSQQNMIEQAIAEKAKSEKSLSLISSQPNLLYKQPLQTEQAEFNAFLKSLKGVESFSFDQFAVADDFTRRRFSRKQGTHFKWKIPKNANKRLTGSMLLDFCKKNRQLKKLKLANVANINNINLKEALACLECLESLTIKDNIHAKTVMKLTKVLDFSRLQALSSLKKLEYPLHGIEELNALEFYKNLETLKLSLRVFKECPLQINDKIINKLINSKINCLEISSFGRVYSNLASIMELITTIPLKLKKLVLNSQPINLNSLLSAVSRSSSLTELQLIDCLLGIKDEKSLLLLFQQCKNLKTIHFTRCLYLGECEKLVEKFTKTNPAIKIIFNVLEGNRNAFN